MTAKLQAEEIVRLKQMGVLGVISKPFDPMTLAESVRLLWEAGPRATAQSEARAAAPVSDLSTALSGIRDQYVATLPDRIHEIRALCESTRLQSDPDAILSLHRAVHTLHGSAETFGLPAVTGVARKFDERMAQLIEHAQPIDAASLTPIFALLSELEQTALDRSNTKQTQAIPAVAIREPQQPRAVTPAAPSIYLLEHEPEIAASLAAQLDGFGYAVEQFSEPKLLLQACAAAEPAAIIADIEAPGGGEMVQNAIARLREAKPALPPVIFLSARDDLSARLQAVRAGGVAYFTNPVRIGNLVDKLDELCHSAAPELYRVLVIDDSSEQAAFHSTILRHAGMLTEVVKEPARILEALRTFSPDLVLMDMYMPGCSGDELARVIRQIEPHVGVPIVYLSIERDFDKQVSALFGAGDEFLTKPIQPHHLVSVVTSHIEHYRKLRSLMVQDSLTGLANHSHMQRALEREMARALRHNAPLALAMIDLDDFKRVNDKHGHPTGDRVLRGLSRFLRQGLRTSDLVARYGGEEFAALLPGADGQQALTVIDRLRAEFAALTHYNDQDQAFSCSFSAGVAAVPAQRAARDLLLAADRALYAAKERGRNRVVLAA